VPEVFIDSPAGTVTSGGTDAPAAGTSETLTVTAAAAFPAASASATPPTWFHVSDPAAPSEVMLVTAAPGGTGTGQSWTVTRGADGTTPVTHATGYQITQVVPAGSLNAMVPQISVLATSQTVGSTSPVQVGSFAATLVAGNTYTGRAKITVDANSGGTAEFRWTGPASPSLLEMDIMSQQLNTADAYQQGTVQSATGYNSGFLDTPELATTLYIVWLEITITPSADGTLELICANAAGASDTFDLGVGSYLRVEQVAAAS
jgi:hypothetical protein